MLAMIVDFKTSISVKSPTSYTGLGKQDTLSMPQKYLTYGITGIVLTDPSLEKKQNPFRSQSKRCLVVSRVLVRLTTGKKAIEFAESCTVTKNLENTWMKCGA